MGNKVLIYGCTLWLIALREINPYYGLNVSKIARIVISELSDGAKKTQLILLSITIG